MKRIWTVEDEEEKAVALLEASTHPAVIRRLDASGRPWERCWEIRRATKEEQVTFKVLQRLNPSRDGILWLKNPY